MPFKDPEKKKQNAKLYHIANKEIINKRSADWKKNNPERYSQDQKNWREENKEKKRIAQAKYLFKIRMKVLVHYGGNPPKCACCGESIIPFLTIDHINNDGNIQRKAMKIDGYGKGLYRWLIKNNFPKGYQILCYSCNLGKAHNNGICPHIIDNVTKWYLESIGVV